MIYKHSWYSNYICEAINNYYGDSMVNNKFCSYRTGRIVYFDAYLLLINNKKIEYKKGRDGEK